MLFNGVSHWKNLQKWGTVAKLLKYLTWKNRRTSGFLDKGYVDVDTDQLLSSEYGNEGRIDFFLINYNLWFWKKTVTHLSAE